MKIALTSQESSLLQAKGIPFDKSKDYTDDEALYLLEQVREIECSYAQYESGHEATLYMQYSRLGDKIYSQIPEN